ncbi:hypothetical protein [Streptomyces sp. MUSC 14]|uniref:hypothetical protein n=1 Tax=Streptomyces sp. MUSC 14 TaxID=1354889 RepID=UPI000AFDFD6E|nr:hypothetical protein [Streptomyces sp. MUSC 14]
MAGCPAEPAVDIPSPSGLPIRHPTPKPVFVDISGGRRRRLRILVAALVTPAAAYVALLISTLVGGPTLPALLPHPLRPKPGAAVAHTHVAPRARTSRTAGTARRQGIPSLATTAGAKTVDRTSADVKSSATAKPSLAATSSPTATSSPKPSPTAKPSPSPTRSKGHKPSPHPTRTPTATPSTAPPLGLG